MQEIIKNITRQDIYNIVTPIAVCVLGWIFSFGKNLKDKSKEKWMCSSKSNTYAYQIFIFKCILIGIPFAGLGLTVIGIIVTFASELLLHTEVPEEYVFKILALWMGVIGISLIKKYKYFCKKIKLRKNIKHKKLTTNFLYYTPCIISICAWILGSYGSNIRIINVALAILMIFCEGIAYFSIDDTEKFYYTYAILYFSDGSKRKFRTDCLKQKGSWIIAHNLENTYEIRYRRENLVKVKYFNTKEDSTAG